MNLSARYDTLWSQSIQKFKAGQFEYDPLIDSEDDTRYGITLLARPSAEIRQAIQDVLQKIKAVAPQQYYYPSSDLHVTVLSVISCYPGFSLDDIDPAEYVSLIRSAVFPVSSFTLTFDGLTASPSCIMVRSFPEDDQLNILRNRLRNAFGISGLQHSIDRRYRLQTAHTTVIRFRQPLATPEAFVEKITELKEAPLGSCLIEELELVANDWYQRKNKVQVIERFRLGRQHV